MLYCTHRFCETVTHLQYSRKLLVLYLPPPLAPGTSFKCPPNTSNVEKNGPDITVGSHTETQGLKCDTLLPEVGMASVSQLWFRSEIRRCFSPTLPCASGCSGTNRVPDGVGTSDLWQLASSGDSPANARRPVFLSKILYAEYRLQSKIPSCDLHAWAQSSMLTISSSVERNYGVNTSSPQEDFIGVEVDAGHWCDTVPQE